MLEYEWRPLKNKTNAAGEQDGEILVRSVLDNGNKRQQEERLIFPSLYRARSDLGTKSVAWILNNIDSVTKKVKP